MSPQHYRAESRSGAPRSRILWGSTILRTALLILGILLLALLLAEAQGSPCPHAATTDAGVARLIHHPGKGRASVIVSVDGQLTHPRLEALRRVGARIGRKLPLIHAVAVTIPTFSLRRLEDLEFVTHISSDGQVKKCDAFTVGHTGADVAFEQQNLTGAGVGIAIIDSGINPHPDLWSACGFQCRIIASVSFVSGQNALDSYGHGTHVAGIAAGDGFSSSGPNCYRTFYGIARGANLIDVRVLDGSGSGSVSQAIAGIQWAVAHRSQLNIRVINLSFGHSAGESYTTDPLCQAVEQAWSAGIVVVCAAGNGGRKNLLPLLSADNEGYGTAYGSIDSPGNDPYVITVGAMKFVDGNRTDDRIATYSGRGPSRLDFVLKPDIVAPGNQVISLRSPGSNLDISDILTNGVPTSAYMKNPPLLMPSAYFKLSGTSMSTPVVSGAVALLLQANPALSPDTVKARLMISADKWCFPDGTADACTFGAGYLDIPAALQCSVVLSQPALSPTLAQNADGTVSLAASGSNGLWGLGIPSLSTVWGQRAIWGSGTLSSSHAIWGDSVWGDRAIWGSSQVLSLPLISGE